MKHEAIDCQKKKKLNRIADHLISFKIHLK
jgi:hypothetical protein